MGACTLTSLTVYKANLKNRSMKEKFSLADVVNELAV